MAAPRERTPAAGAPLSSDPDQLTLGGLDPSAATPPAVATVPEDQSAEQPEYREPPVCGEWSYDIDEIPDARAIPVAAVVSVPAPGVRESAARSPSTAPGHNQGPGSAPPVPPPGAVRRVAQRSATPPTPLPALEELKSIHDAHPGDEQTALALSGALAKRGNIEGALGVLQRAIDSGGDGVMLRCARATILSGRLRYDDAERELRRAQKLKPDDTGVLLQQGILACRRAKWREAVEPLERVARHDPLSGQAHFYLGEALSKLDRLGEALEAYHRASELEPDNWRAFKGVGIVLDRLGRPAEAAEYYRRARDGQRG